MIDFIKAWAIVVENDEYRKWSKYRDLSDYLMMQRNFILKYMLNERLNSSYAPWTESCQLYVPLIDLPEDINNLL